MFSKKLATDELILFYSIKKLLLDILLELKICILKYPKIFDKNNKKLNFYKNYVSKKK